MIITSQTANNFLIVLKSKPALNAKFKKKKTSLNFSFPFLKPMMGRIKEEQGFKLSVCLV